MSARGLLSNARIDEIAKAQDDEGWLVRQLTRLEWRWFARDIERAVIEKLEERARLAQEASATHGPH